MSENIKIYVKALGFNDPFYDFYLDWNGENKITNLKLDSSKSYTFYRVKDEISHPFYISDVKYKENSTSKINISGDGKFDSGITGSQSFTLSFSDNFNSKKDNILYYCSSHPVMQKDFSFENFNYYIIAPHNVAIYNFSDVSPRPNAENRFASNTKDYLVSKRYARLFRRSQENVSPSPWTNFDIFNNKLRNSPAIPDRTKYINYKEKVYGDLNISEIASKVAFGTSSNTLYDEKYHMSEILHDFERGFFPWFYSVNKKGINSIFGSFGNDYLIIKSKDTLDFSKHERVSSQGNSSSIFYQEKGFEISSVNIDWGSISLEDREENLFSRSWFSTVFSGPYIDESGKYHIAEKSFGDQSDPENKKIEFHIIDEIEDIHEYKNWVKENYSNKIFNKLNSDYRWSEKNIPSLEKSSLESLSVPQSVRNPKSTFAFIGMQNFSPESCPSKWEEITDGSWICEDGSAVNYCDIKKTSDLSIIKDSDELQEINLKLNKKGTVVQIPGSVLVKKSGGTVEVKLAPYNPESEEDAPCEELNQRVINLAEFTQDVNEGVVAFNPKLSSLDKTIDKKANLEGKFLKIDEKAYAFLDSMSIKELKENAVRVSWCKAQKQAKAKAIAENQYDPEKPPSPWSFFYDNLKTALRDVNAYHKAAKKVSFDELASPDTKDGMYTSALVRTEGDYQLSYGSFDFSQEALLLNENLINPFSLLPKIKSKEIVQNPDILNLGRISVGEGFTMLVKPDGTLWASGSNENGKLGLGQDFGDQLDFTQVNTAATGISKVKAVFCGKEHHLILKEDGTLYGVGKNDFGQIGEKTGGDIHWEYVAIHGSFDQGQVVYAATSADASYYILSDGTLWALGNNSIGQVNPYLNDSFVSTPLKLDSNVSQVAAGKDCCAYIKDGVLNGIGMLSISRSVPNIIDNGVSRCCLGEKHLAYVKDGSVYGLGDNKYGQLGSYTRSSKEFFKYKPELLFPIGSVDSSAFSDVVSSFNSNSLLLLTTKGNVFFKGRNYLGPTNKIVYPGASFHSLACGDKHFGYSDTFNNFYTQGLNRNGSLGNGGLANSPEAAIVIQDPGFDPSVHNLAPEDYSSNLFCFFDRRLFFVQNDKLKLLSDSSGVASEISVEGSIKEVFSGDFGVFAISKLEDAYKIFKITELDSNALTEKVDTFQTDSPDNRFRYFKSSKKYFEGASSTNGQILFSLDSFENVEEKKSISFTLAGSTESLAIEFYYRIKSESKLKFISPDGQVYETNISGSSAEVFQKTNEGYSSEVSVSEVFQSEKEISSFSVGKSHVLFTISDGSLWGYGKNSSGELGDGSLAEVTSPKKLQDSNIALCSAGNETSLFVRRSQTEDTLYGCGDNSVGQLGFSSKHFSKKYFPQKLAGSPLRSSQPSTEPIKEPLKIISIGHDYRGIKSISSGEVNSAITTGSGNVFVAGHNDKGQLGTISSEKNLISKVKFNKSFNTLESFSESEKNMYLSFEDSMNSHSLRQFSDLNVKKVFCGNGYTLFLTENNQLWGCGLNYNSYFSGSQKNISGALGSLLGASFAPVKIKDFVTNFNSLDNTTTFINSEEDGIFISGNGVINFTDIDFSDLANEKIKLDQTFNLGFLDIFSKSEGPDFSFLSESKIKQKKNNTEEAEDLNEMMTSEASLSEGDSLLNYLDDLINSKKLPFNLESQASYAINYKEWFDKVIHPTDDKKLVYFYENIDFAKDEGSYRNYGAGAVACFSEDDEEYQKFWQSQYGNRDLIRQGSEPIEVKPCDDGTQDLPEMMGFEGKNLKPYMSKKSDDVSWECAIGFYHDMYIGTPTATSQPQLLEVSCNYFTDRFGKTSQFRQILSPGDTAFIAEEKEGNVYPNANIELTYIKEGSAVISASTVNESCSNFGLVSMSDQGATHEDWNKGESSCPLPGCTDEDACNYDELASCDDGSCTYSCYGCANSSACNYDSSATIDCPNSTSNLNIDCIPCDFSSCKGCTESQACNYDEAATMDDGTCEYTSCIGCMDEEACDYDPEATKEGSCDYDSCVTPTTTGVPVYHEYASCEDPNQRIYTKNFKGNFVILK